MPDEREADPSRGMSPEPLRGNDPTGVDRKTTDSATGNDREMPSGTDGREGGAAGNFLRQEPGETVKDRPRKA